MTETSPLAPEYGRAFALWRAADPATWRSYTHHGFVAGLGDGSLPTACFRHYLVQDYVFLVHFARAWALAVVKAQSIAEMRAASATVEALINTEMQLHIETCAGLGISEAELFNARESPANMAYTRYVLDAGFAGDLADLLAALAPCVLGYGEIGARLGLSASSTTYGDWIGTYASAEYQDLCRDVGSLIDQALAARIGEDFTASPRWAALTQRFQAATRLEAGFWQMGLDRS
ncbi:MAG: thiaminase II [Mangrovicoccus sp.]